MNQEFGEGLMRQPSSGAKLPEGICLPLPFGNIPEVHKLIAINWGVRKTKHIRQHLLFQTPLYYRYCLV